jgi:lipopolysaccharide/colanic/teichoic acid biosynthesis glycosyltransferase
MPFDNQDTSFKMKLATPTLSYTHVPQPSQTGPALSYERVLKRFLDVSAVLLSAVFVVPLIAIMALLVARDGHSPFYTQKRVGRGGKVFRIIKMRTMVHNADALLEKHLAANPDLRQEWDATQKLKDDIRITRIGRILRKTSMDELPQLFNVLMGSMSLVGPRPMMPAQQDIYPGSSYYRLRPGITGFWQISDRNDCDFADRAKYDASYAAQVSFKTDMSVLWRTIAVVLRGTGY